MVPEPSPPPEPVAPHDDAVTPAVVPLPDLLRTDGPPRSAAARIGLISAAIVLFILGVIFWLIPVLTGLPFYIASFVCLGMASRRVARWINRHERRLPERYRLWLRPAVRRERKRRA